MGVQKLEKVKGTKKLNYKIRGTKNASHLSF